MRGYRSITAQVAVEAIVNHPHDGWDVATMQAVLTEARSSNVPKLYVDMLQEAVDESAATVGALR